MLVEGFELEQFSSMEACALVPCDLPEPRTLSRYYSPNVEDDYRRRFPPLSLADLLGLVQEGRWSPSGSDGNCRHYLHPPGPAC